MTDMRVALAIAVLGLGVGASTSAPLARASSRNPSQAQIRSAVRQAERSSSLWATVNICDSRRYPNMLGIRGQMPSLGFSASLSMTIQVNYYSARRRRFVLDPRTVKTVTPGRSTLRLEQKGATFGPFTPHAGLFDAVVQFAWWRSGRLLGSETRATTAGHPDADFGSPRHYSAARCRIT